MNLDITNGTVFAGLQIPHNAHFANCENNRAIQLQVKQCRTKQSIKDKKIII